eukprot:TRINITY_DN2417_c0_g1_i1.p1 TRINITY_DN2417_c0_g1~~TRINITY_DN2417_c0_g1_i1.p1  ORF type:complete len:451 (-),score=79.72 TRINITY_DN2417_c0_g1_i1:84-1436(-)
MANLKLFAVVLCGYLCGNVCATVLCVNSMLETEIISSFELTCPTGEVITNITFASYGGPLGTCGGNNLRSVACEPIPTDAVHQLQATVDFNVHWFLDILCYGRGSCSWAEYIGNEFSADQVFGDPCPDSIKWLTVEAICGTMPPPQVSTGAPVWSTDQSLNWQNFISSRQLVTNMYSTVDRTASFDALMQNYQALQLNFNPSSTTPFRFVPLITLERQFSIAYNGYTSSWFGIVSRLLSIDGFIVVAFRGTVTTTDWLYNADVETVVLPESMQSAKFSVSPQAMAHKGFLALYSGMRNMLLAGVQAYDPKGIIITGHSLGGAFATFAAYDLANLGYPVHSVYTFASPRVGNPYFVSLVNQALASVGAQMYRIANSADIVTQVPPSALSIGGNTGKYMHVGDLDCTYEFIPEDDSVLDTSMGDFVSWAHNLTTYERYAPQFIQIVNAPATQ